MATAKDGEFSRPPTPNQKMTSTNHIEKTPVSSQSSAIGPTPNSRKKGFAPSNFMSPTDALVSPCTQRLMSKRQTKGMPLRPKFIHSVSRKGVAKPPSSTTGSKLANKENTHRATAVKKVEDEEIAPAPVQEVQEY